MPEGRPYSLGNTSQDLASINATSEMSASSRARPDGRIRENPRAVSYENDARYAPGVQAGQRLCAGRSARPQRIADRTRALLSLSVKPHSP